MKKLSLSLLAACLFLFACHKDARKESNAQPETPARVTTPDPGLYNTLLEAGYKKEDIIEYGSWYVVDGDLAFKKNDVDLVKVRKYLKIGEREVLSQTIANGVHYNYTNTIKVKIDPSLMNDWDYQMRQAMQNWATISDCRINFFQLRSTDADALADIVVVPDNNSLPNNTWGWAEFPTMSGVPGWRIHVNTNFYSTNPGAQVPVNDRGSNKINNFTHEIGHCIGFEHTDAFAANISGTSQNDPNSVMNSGTAAHLWTSFSAGDLLAARSVYPVTESIEYVTFPEGDYNANFTNIQVTYEGFPVNWSSSLISSSTVTIEVLHNKTVLGTVVANTSNDGSYFFSEDDYHSFFGWENDVFMVQVRVKNDVTGVFDDSPMFHINWE